jgi:TrmH family RNA methyltransferase
VSRVVEVTSRDNPLLATVRKLSRDAGAYRRQQQLWLEGEHLLSALLARGGQPEQVLIAESAWAEPALQALAVRAPRVVRLPDGLMATVSGLESPPRIGALLALPAPRPIDPALGSVVLDRLQDAGNVGSILRSAAALGVAQVLAMKGTAALWSQKVLRAAQGAHFGLALHEGLMIDDLAALAVPLVGTSLQAPALLPQARLPWPCAWVLGHEGQGADPALLARCALTVRIPQPGGEESLNVAAAAAVCLYESLRQRS